MNLWAWWKGSILFLVNNSSVHSALIREYLGNHVLFGVQCFPEDNEKYPKEGKHGVKNERENRIGKSTVITEDRRVVWLEKHDSLQKYKGCHRVMALHTGAEDKLVTHMESQGVSWQVKIRNNILMVELAVSGRGRLEVFEQSLGKIVANVMNIG